MASHNAPTIDPALVSGDLFIRPELSQFGANRRTCNVVVESKNVNGGAAIESLGSMAARNLALGYAGTQGIGSPRINGNVEGPYPVNADGVELDKLGKDVPATPTHPKRQPKAYRITVPVCGPLM